jgi:hypothetical protein
MAVEVFLPLPFEDLLLGAEPVLFFLARFTASVLIELISSRSYPVLRWDSVWHHCHLARGAFRSNGNLCLPLFGSLRIVH